MKNIGKWWFSGGLVVVSWWFNQQNGGFNGIPMWPSNDHSLRMIKQMDDQTLTTNWWYIDNIYNPCISGVFQEISFGIQSYFSLPSPKCSGWFCEGRTPIFVHITSQSWWFSKLDTQNSSQNWWIIIIDFYILNIIHV